MWVDIVLLSLAFIMCLVGIVGSIVPGLPGPPVSFVGVLLAYFCSGLESTTFNIVILLLAFIFAVVVTILDTIAPILLTRMTGGSKAGTWGATIGLVIGLVVSLFGFWYAPLLGAFFGALLGELLVKTPFNKAFEISCYSFASFIITTGMKLIYSIIALAVVIYDALLVVFDLL